MAWADLRGRRALISGASRGIGAAIAKELAAAGADVVINYAGAGAAAEEVAAACRLCGVRAKAIAADISQAAECERLVAKAAEFLGGVDILVNNAGIVRDNLLMRMSEAEIDEVLATNLRGAILLSKHCSRLMMKQRYGRIISIGSVVGMVGNAGQVNYAAAKAGLIGMTKSLARELAARGITANVVAPGFIATDMTAKLNPAQQEAMIGTVPLGRAGTARDVAAAVLFLASDMAGYITGEVLRVDGGMAM